MSIGDTSSSSSTSDAPMCTVAILGAAYGGAHAAELLAASLPPNWRVVLIDRNSHFNNVYVFPRMIAIPKHAPKAFIPYTNIFVTGESDAAAEPAKTDKGNGNVDGHSNGNSNGATNGSATQGSKNKTRHELVQGEIVALSAYSVDVVEADAKGGYGSSASGNGSTIARTIPFDYCIYALGASLPAPCDVWGGVTAGRGSKLGGIRWMEGQGEVLAGTQRILIVGGGALGIQYATDLKDLHPTKEITLLHSRERLLPIYPLEMHTAVVEALARLGVNVCLGERVMQWPGSNDGPGEKVVVTDKGTRFTADIVLACTGQKPHVALAREMCGLAPTGRLHVRPTMQVVGKDESNLDHMFAVGDCAETGAIQAGHTAWYQAEVAARNVQRLIDGVVVAELESYKVTPPAIKVTLGLTHYVKAAGGVVETGDDGKEDLDARLVWGGSCHAQDLGDDE